MDKEEEFIEIKGKIVSGVYALTTRTFILQIISFIATFILTILLSPSVFGVFFIVSAVISFLSYFSDVGLAAALIQKKSRPTRAEYVSVFTVQQILVGSVAIVFILLSPYFGALYGLSNEGVFLLRALLVSFFLSSLKTIPSVILERKLNFSLLVIPQVLETFVFYLLAIVLAVKGFGITSFAYAAVVRGLTGVISIYIISPWPISFGISLSKLKGLLSFGFPFQANSLLALIKDDLMTIVLGKILPFSQIGYLGWAKKWAEAPLRLIMDSIIRVTFPAFSRLQHEKVFLGKALSKSFLFLAVFIFPITSLLILYIKPIINIIPKYSKWEPALIPFYLFAVASIFASFSSPLINALNAIGKIKITLVLMIFWTVLTWVLVPSLSIRFSYIGAAFAYFIISFTGIIPIILMKRVVAFQVISPIVKPFMATILMNIVIFFIFNQNQSMGNLVFSLFAGLTLYILVIWFFMKQELLPYLPKLFK